MAIRRLYKMRNLGVTGVKWIRTTDTKILSGLETEVTTGVKAELNGLTKGECFGYSTIWVTDMLHGRNPEEFPADDELRAGVLQQKAEMWVKKSGWDDAIKKVIKDLGFVVKKKMQIPWKQTVDRISFESGFFLVDIGVHWVAMGTTQSHYYFFDANRGLFQYDQRFEFHKDVNSDSHLGFGDYHRRGAMTNVGQVCNCYQITL